MAAISEVPSPTAGDPRQLVVVLGDLVGQEGAARGFPPNQVENPVAYAGAAREAEGRAGGRGVSSEQGVVKEAPVLGEPIGEGVVGAGHVTRDEGVGLGGDRQQSAHDRTVESGPWSRVNTRRKPVRR